MDFLGIFKVVGIFEIIGIWIFYLRRYNVFLGIIF